MCTCSLLLHMPRNDLTLSISENSIRSSFVQFRPMGEMLSMPFLNSMKVPLQVNPTTFNLLYYFWKQSRVSQDTQLLDIEGFRQSESKLCVTLRAELVAFRQHLTFSWVVWSAPCSWGRNWSDPAAAPPRFGSEWPDGITAIQSPRDHMGGFKATLIPS